MLMRSEEKEDIGKVVSRVKRIFYNEGGDVMLKYKHIEAARETRLWIGQVLVPAVTGAIILYSNPDLRRWIDEKVKSIKNKFKKNGA